MMPNQIYALVTVFIVFISALTIQYVKILHLKTDIANLNASIAYREVSIEKLETNNKELKHSLSIQNEAIDKLSVDKAEADKKLAEWKAKPADIRYEVIYKIREVKSDVCEDIKDTIDIIRSIDYNSL